MNLSVPPSQWDKWFLDLVFTIVVTIGVAVFGLAAFLIRLMIKREMERLNDTLTAMQQSFTTFTGLIQAKFENHEHRLSLMEGSYFGPDGAYRGPERRRQAPVAPTEQPES